MRKVLLTFAIVSMIAMAGAASAQTPYIQVYFDAGFQEASADCPTVVGTLDTLYIVAHNFNMFIGAAEFMVDYTSHLTPLAEQANGTPLVIGESSTGVAISWPLPQNGFDPFLMMTVTVEWNCTDCAGIGGTPGSELVVQAKPGKTSARAIDYYELTSVDAVGMTSLICAQVPVENTSWGQIKSLYN
jgi:hypothetical protein